MDRKDENLKELGDIMFSIGNYKKAIEIYSSLPLDDIIANNIGLCYVKLGMYKEGMKYYRIALSINPRNSDVYFNLAKLYYRIGKYKKSLKYFKKCIMLDKKNVSAMNNIGLILSLVRKYRKAIKYYEKVIKINSYYEWTWYNLAQLALLFGLEDEAKVLLANLSIMEDPEFAEYSRA